MSSARKGQSDYTSHRLVVVNRGEIALRIFRTAKRIGIQTIAVYTPSDVCAPHVLFADDALAIPVPSENAASKSESSAFLFIDGIISAISKYNAGHKDYPITLVHPGYGFLSENAVFASRIANETGATWIGPSPEVIAEMGLKHVSRQAAIRAGIPVVPGSQGLLGSDSNEVLNIAKNIGFPIILKATAGGGGMAMIVCNNEEEVLSELERAKERAKVLFNDEGVFLEKYFPTARHIEIQVFGNGLGDVVHLAERECSIQRRHQKIIEETPSPFLEANGGIREQMCAAAVALCREIKYRSAGTPVTKFVVLWLSCVGTVEFIVDDQSGKFFFLEMNTRIQVEHPITEEIHLGLDLIELMIQQAVFERGALRGFPTESPEMQQERYDQLRNEGRKDGLHGHAIQGRLYAENPAENFIPSSGLLQYVDLPINENSIRIENSVSTGMTITPSFDPLLCKIIVSAKDRQSAIKRFIQALDMCTISGPPNNIEYLRDIAESDFFKGGKTLTTSLNQFSYKPRALKILSAGIDMSVQDFPGRTIGLGMPRSGPMDEMGFRVGNILVGNPQTTEGIEMVLLPGMPPVTIKFFCPAIIAVTGRDVEVTVNNELKETWNRVPVPEDSILNIKARVPPEGRNVVGFRVYICIYGGFPGIPAYLGSKSTSVGLGGYQGRTLISGDQLALKGLVYPAQELEIRNKTQYSPLSSPLRRCLTPSYPDTWIIYVLPGPCDNTEYVTEEGIKKFYNTKWIVSPSSNRMGIRLQSSDGSKIEWARENGGEGGSHPSNILDNAYAPATVNINGDTPVILTNEGPDMGGYLCLCTVASAERWKLGQLNPGSSIQFSRISWLQALKLRKRMSEFYENVRVSSGAIDAQTLKDILTDNIPDTPLSPILHVKGNEEDMNWNTRVVFRQAGDDGILMDFGRMTLDFFIRARIHAFQEAILKKNPRGLRLLCPCIRSIMCCFDPIELSQSDFLSFLIEIEASIPDSVADMTFPARRLTLPIVLDDRWNREALERYMKSTRNKAVYLPSNIQYLADNNGLASPEEALQKLIQSDWLVFGVGFYLACPFLVPIDPRCRLEGQKMNPSRTFTPKGAIGIAGPVAAIYPIESPGGYQLYGRTLPLWQTWGKGSDYRPEKPWLLGTFDQIHFEPVTEEEYLTLERDFDAGLYKFKIEDTVFSMKEYADFVRSIEEESLIFRQKQARAKLVTEAREKVLLAIWESEKESSESQAIEEGEETSHEFVVRATLFAYIWKIKCNPGQIIDSAEQVLLILEAMKTEIPVKAGEEYIGWEIKGFGKGIREGAAVRPGDVLVVLDPISSD